MTNPFAHSPLLVEKKPYQKWLDWAKAHQEVIAVGSIIAIILAIGVPYYLHSQQQNEETAQGVLNLGQYYLRSTVDPKNGPFKNEVEKNQQALQTFQRITTDYSGTHTAKIARFYSAKCQYVLQQYTQAYANYDVAVQELKGTPLSDEAYFGKVLCLEAENQLPQSETLMVSFLKDHSDSFISTEIRLNLADLFLKGQEKDKAVEQLQLVSKSYKDTDWGMEADRRLKEMNP
jgi:tetratricopeptide (TPR) repeat protein